jgi:protein tyrosine/serine phosphatase
MRWTGLAALAMLLVAAPASAEEAGSTCVSPGRDGWARPVELKNVADFNLHRVTDGFYRSAQPNEKAFATLADQLHIRTVVSLRAFHPDEPLARGVSLHLASRIPMHTWHIEWGDVVKALKEVRQASPDAPVLLHCEHGADRTGLITALYRILYEGWCKEAAIAEMMNGGFGFHAVWGNIPAFIRGVDVERLRRDVDQ